MDKHIENVYLGEIVTECTSAIAAVQKMNTLLKDSHSVGEFYREAGDFLQHAACVSKLLWSPDVKKPRAAARGDHLRASLGLTAGHALESRALRNLLEHIDDRIDDWAETSANKNILKMAIAPRADIASSGFKQDEVLRHFDPNTNIFTFRGEPFDLQKIVEGVQDVLARVKQRKVALGFPY